MNTLYVSRVALLLRFKIMYHCLNSLYFLTMTGTFFWNKSILCTFIAYFHIKLDAKRMFRLNEKKNKIIMY